MAGRKPGRASMSGRSRNPVIRSGHLERRRYMISDVGDVMPNAEETASLQATYRQIIEHYEACLDRHGTGPHAVDWKDTGSAAIRYDVMLGLLEHERTAVNLLDFGCGLAGLRDHMEGRGMVRHSYAGLEISEAFAAAARARRPDLKIYTGDVLTSHEMRIPCDYLVMNGVFTRRGALSNDAMMDYLQRLVERVWPWAARGLALNVMSCAVDWHGDGLFHPDTGALASWLGSRISRHFVLRNDYGLHETTVYVFREPRRFPPLPMTA